VQVLIAGLLLHAPSGNDLSTPIDGTKGNAVDFHIMQNLQAWAPMPSVMSTADIVRNFPQFLVIEQPGRAWFRNLLATKGVIAEKLATSGSDLSSCTLWKVKNVHAGP
jgi:hypothetical protein